MPEIAAGASSADRMDDLERTLAFTDACGEVLDRRRLLARAGARLLEGIPADVAAVVLPDESTATVHYSSRWPLLPLAEGSLRIEAAAALRRTGFGDVAPATLALARDADVEGLHDAPGDGVLYPIATRALDADGERLGVLVLLARVDWILSARTEARVDAWTPLLARALAQALTVERLRADLAAGADPARVRRSG